MYNYWVFLSNLSFHSGVVIYKACGLLVHFLSLQNRAASDLLLTDGCKSRKLACWTDAPEGAPTTVSLCNSSLSVYSMCDSHLHPPTSLLAELWVNVYILTHCGTASGHQHPRVKYTLLRLYIETRMEKGKHKERCASHVEAQKVGTKRKKTRGQNERRFCRGQTERENRPDTCKYTPPRAMVLSC